MSADGAPSAAVTAASGGGGDDDGSGLPPGGTTADAETLGPDSHVRCWDNMMLTQVDIFLVGPRVFCQSSGILVYKIVLHGLGWQYLDRQGEKNT